VVVKRAGARPHATAVPLDIPFGPQVAALASGWDAGVAKLFATVDARADVYGLEQALADLRAALRLAGPLPAAPVEALIRTAHDEEAPANWRAAASAILEALKPLGPKRVL
jgi:hypothetical protein